jgi:pre-mRNA-splicing factor 38B
MSRAALWRQEGNVKERERQAQETFQLVLEEGKAKNIKGCVPITQSDSFNLNPMLFQNIIQNPYFLKICSKIKDWNALVDEIYYEVKHMEPFTHGTKTPSTAFCLLLRLFTLRCTEKQIHLMLDHIDSPYIRCIGFLYLRFAADPSILWEYCQPYVYDQEPVVVSQSLTSKEITIGDFVRGILIDLEYYGTVLPRLPLVVERNIRNNLLEEQKMEERALYNLRDASKMKYFEAIGSKVQALYGDEENPVAWYDAVVDRVIRKDDETGVEYARPRFKVTYTEYGNTEIVTLGELAMPGPIIDPIPSTKRDDRWHGSDDRRGRNYYDHDRAPFCRHERQQAWGKRDFIHDRRGYRDSYRNHDGDKSRNRRMDRSRSRDRAVTDDRPKSNTDHYKISKSIENKVDNQCSSQSIEETKPTPKSEAELAVIAEKKRKLAARYG